MQKLMEIGTIIGDKAYSVQYIADAPTFGIRDYDLAWVESLIDQDPVYIIDLICISKELLSTGLCMIQLSSMLGWDFFKVS